MVKILGVNTNLAYIDMKNFHQEPFQYCSAFIDYDAVLINTDNLYKQYALEENQGNKEREFTVFSTKASKQIKSDMSRIKTQVQDMLDAGKYVFVMQGENALRYYYTGETETKTEVIQVKVKPKSKSKKPNAFKEINRIRKIKHIAEFNPISFLPIKCKFTKAKGNNFTECKSHIYADFFNNTNKYCNYLAYNELTEEESLVKIEGTEKSVASIIKYSKGKIIFLPMLKPHNEYPDHESWISAINDYLGQLFYLVQQLSTPIQHLPLPDWTKEIEIFDEKSTEAKIIKERERLLKLEKALNKKEIYLRELQSFKELLTAEGIHLINIVSKTLSKLGFKIETDKQYGSFIFAKYSSSQIIIESVGVRKCAVSNHVTALERLVSENIPRNGISPKPILIINAYYKVPLDERPTMVFPFNLSNYAKARNHCLLTSTQLLCLYLEIKNHPEIKKERVAELLNTTGVYERYSDPYSVIMHGKFN